MERRPGRLQRQSPVDLGQSKAFSVTGGAPLELMVLGIARDLKSKEAFAADAANAN